MSVYVRQLSYKLEKLYEKFYTERGTQIARQRQKSAVSFYENMYREVQESYAAGKELLSASLRFS